MRYSKEGPIDVKDVMHTAVTTVTLETRVSIAHQVMTMREARIRHLPVVTNEGILVGLLTDRDLRRAAASDAPPMAEHEWLSLLDKLCVRDIMTPEVVTVHGTQGHLVFGHGVAQQVYNELQGFVPRGALLSRHTSHEPKPFPQVDHHDSTASAPHRGLRRDSRLSPPSGQTPSLARYTLAGLLCDVVWLSQL